MSPTKKAVLIEALKLIRLALDKIQMVVDEIK